MMRRPTLSAAYGAAVFGAAFGGWPGLLLGVVLVVLLGMRAPR